jgi:prenylcysteine oxidase/farnesylcysteine lyase
MRSATLLLLIPHVFGFELPFSVPNIFKHRTQTSSVVYAEVPNISDASHRVAIIGAGAGGSSAAFWISKAKERYGLDTEVDVYERSDYIGGRKSKRSATYTIRLIASCR